MTPSIATAIVLFFCIINAISIVITLRLISRVILVEEKLVDMTGEDLNMNP